MIYDQSKIMPHLHDNNYCCRVQQIYKFAFARILKIRTNFILINLKALIKDSISLLMTCNSECSLSVHKVLPFNLFYLFIFLGSKKLLRCREFKSAC